MAMKKRWLGVGSVGVVILAGTLAVACSSSSNRDDQAPVFKGCAGAAAVGTTSIMVSWTAATDNETPATQIAYEVFVSSTPEIDYHSPPWTFTDATSGTVTGLQSGTSYYFGCKARDLWVNESAETAAVNATTGGATAGTATFSGLLPIIRDTCAGSCHVPGGNAGAAGLILTDSVAYDQLTTKSSQEVAFEDGDAGAGGAGGLDGGGDDGSAGGVSGVGITQFGDGGTPMRLVVPGDPGASWLYNKLSYDPHLQSILSATQTDYMPPPSTGELSPGLITQFHDWIANGAQND